jgi:hypothetical protein
MAEVQPADARVKRLAAIVLLLGFLLGAFLLWGLEAGRPAVVRWLRDDPATIGGKARVLLLAVAVVTAGPPVAAGAYLWRLGERVRETQRFPPVGVRMVQDTVVLAGDAARKRGRILQGLALMLIVTGCAMALLLWALAPR